MSDTRIYMVLFVSADDELRGSGSTKIRAHHHLVDVTGNAGDASCLAGVHQYDCIIADARLPDGPDFYGDLREGCRFGVPVIIVSRVAGDKRLADRLGCSFIHYPYGPGEPLSGLRSVLRFKGVRGRRGSGR